MGRTHDYFCHKCRIHWGPFDMDDCPKCKERRFSEYDLNGDYGQDEPASVEVLKPPGGSPKVAE